MVALNEDKDHLFIDELEHPSLDLYRKQIQQFMTPLVAAEGPTALASRSVRSKGFRSIVDTEFNRRFPGVTFDVNAYEELDDGEASTTSGAQPNQRGRYSNVGHAYERKWHEAGLTLNAVGMDVAVASRSVEQISGSIRHFLDPETSLDLNRTTETRSWRRHEGREMDETILLSLDERLEDLQMHDDSISNNQPKLELLQSGLFEYQRWYKCNIHSEDVVRSQAMKTRLQQLLQCRSRLRFDEVGFYFLIKNTLNP